jgi:hypothetical protein
MGVYTYISADEMPSSPLILQAGDQALMLLSGIWNVPNLNLNCDMIFMGFLSLPYLNCGIVVSRFW